jgi:hypothetical protein
VDSTRRSGLDICRAAAADGDFGEEANGAAPSVLRGTLFAADPVSRGAPAAAEGAVPPASSGPRAGVSSACGAGEETGGLAGVIVDPRGAPERSRDAPITAAATSTTAPAAIEICFG